jgi:hypothetical protein
MTEASRDLAPDRRPLTNLQSKRLAAMSGLEAKSLAGMTVADITEKLKFRIDPQLLLFRRICGKVVKRDPINGAEYPVPFATVNVEDTDCSFLGLFPVEAPWSWFFPLFCHREVIGTTTTDACGRFCVLVPRWDIDWILRFRKERVCFWDIFIRPSIRDILNGLRLPGVIPRPNPGPDPEPDPPPILKDGGITLRRVEDVLGRHVASQLARHEIGTAFGKDRTQHLDLLDRPAFSTNLPPPLPDEFKRIDRRGTGHADASMEAARNTLATRLKIAPDRLAKLDFARCIGPFRRCFDIVLAEWVPIFDVPDITFRVTQDVNGDGTQEVIYSESYFDVRWNATTIPDVTLVASPIAVAGRICDAPTVPCANTPAILFAGRFPLENAAAPADPYYDVASGYARRPNRPHPSGLISDPLPNPLSEAPFAGVVSLYGCNRISGAVFYRLRYRFSADGTALGPLASFVGLTWPLYRVVGGVLQVHWPAADAAGWYPVLAAADNWFPDLLLLDWPTGSFEPGLYAVQLEIGNAAKHVIGTSATVGFRIDNRAPSATFTRLRWKKTSEALWRELPLTCAVIPRGVAPADIQIEVSFTASAEHLRSVQLTSGGCGAGIPIPPASLSLTQHWYTAPLDHAVSRVAIFTVPADAVHPAGAYSFSLNAVSRAFNPSGGDGGQLADWEYDPVYIHAVPSLPVAIVNADA